MINGLQKIILLGTPTIFINGYKYHDSYTVKDYKIHFRINPLRSVSLIYQPDYANRLM